MNEPNLPFRYEKPDVVAAQRLRFRHSVRLRVLAFLSLAAVAYLGTQQVSPGTLGLTDTMGWPLTIGLAALFVLLPVLFYLFVPMLDYRSNAAWRQNYVLSFNKAGLRLRRAGAAAGFELVWPGVRRVLEDEKVFLLFFGGKQGMVMVPKRIFSSADQAGAFRRLAIGSD